MRFKTRNKSCTTDDYLELAVWHSQSFNKHWLFEHLNQGLRNSNIDLTGPRDRSFVRGFQKRVGAVDDLSAQGSAVEEERLGSSLFVGRLVNEELHKMAQFGDLQLAR
jgi:hypothetical protein